MECYRPFRLGLGAEVAFMWRYLRFRENVELVNCRTGEVGGQGHGVVIICRVCGEVNQEGPGVRSMQAGWLIGFPGAPSADEDAV